MSYDIYCYRSALGKADIHEAKALLEAEDSGIISKEDSDKLVSALLEHNPRLEKFVYDYEEIAESEGISIEQAKAEYSDIELNTPDEDLAIQITIADIVTIGVPYWYTDNRAEEVFKLVYDYAKVIRNTTGYFVYDPQKEKVYDPLKDDFGDVSIYKEIATNIQKNGRYVKKPWWKFW